MSHLLDLPPEVLGVVARNLCVSDVLCLCAASTRARRAFSCDPVWRELVRRNYALVPANWRPYMSTAEMDACVDMGGSCYAYCMGRIDDKQCLEALVDDIAKWRIRPHTSDHDDAGIALEARIRTCIAHFPRYAHFAMALRRRLSSTTNFRRLDCLTPHQTWHLVRERAAHLHQIAIATTLCERAGERALLDTFRTLICSQDSYILNLSLEETLVTASYVDPLFQDLIHIREIVTNAILLQYSLQHASLTCNVDKVKLLMHLLDSELLLRSCSPHYHPSPDSDNLQSSLILRAYAGLAAPSPLVFNAIVVRLCNLLHIEISMNEIALCVPQDSSFRYLIHANNSTAVFDTSRPDLFGHFPLLADKYAEFNAEYHSESKLLTSASWARYVNVSILDSILCKVHCADERMKMFQRGENPEYVGFPPIVSTGISIISQNRLEKLRWKALLERKALNPTTPSGHACLEFLNKYPQNQTLNALEPYIPITPTLLGSFKLVPNPSFQKKANLAIVTSPHELPPVGSIVTAGLDTQALLLDYYLPKDMSGHPTLDTTNLLMDQGFAVLLTGSTYWVVNAGELRHIPPRRFDSVYNDHAGMFFSGVATSQTHFVK